VRSAPRPVPGGPRDAASALDAALRIHPGREALVGRTARYSYAELDAAADRAVGALAALGIGPGDRVAMSLPNSAELAVAFLATMRAGAVWVGVALPLAPPEKRYQLEDAGASVLLTTVEVAASLGTVSARTVTLDPATGSGAWTDLVAASAPAPRRPIDPHAPAAIAYTSGTTGRPKGAVHSQHNMLWPGAVTRDVDPAPDGERQGVVLPMTLLNLEILGPLTSWIRGATCVCVDRTDPVGLASWIREERLTRMIAVPAMLHDLLTYDGVDPGDLATLTRPECGGAHTPQAFRDLYRERFGAEVLTGYGLTEAPTAVCREMPEHPRSPGSSGRAREALEVVVVDDDGRELPPGAQGEICVRARRDGPWADFYTPMLGYWRRPDATARALRGGMLHTDDLGRVDEDGNLHVLDRAKELIVRGGANVYPAEVERVLHEDDRVAACAVFGVPDPRLGERVVAAVQPRPGVPVTTEELLERCRAELARYKVPERIVLVEDLPRTPMGKIRKRELPGLLGGDSGPPT
jgi:long-chain acyl-CoA synthetase